MEKFIDRRDAGKQLATPLKKYAKQPNAIILALPRGGVVVGAELSKVLDLPLDIILVRKLGVPKHEELAFGAIGEGDVIIKDERLIKDASISVQEMNSIIMREKAELQRRKQLYRQGRPTLDIKNHTVILVDDGIATGATMLAAIDVIKKLGPSCLVIAIPVSSNDALLKIQQRVDEVVCLATLEPLFAVGAWYEDFAQTTDEEVCNLLKILT